MLCVIRTALYTHTEFSHFRRIARTDHGDTLCAFLKSSIKGLSQTFQSRSTQLLIARASRVCSLALSESQDTTTIAV
jgi:hypothetical protein